MSPSQHVCMVCVDIAHRLLCCFKLVNTVSLAHALQPSRDNSHLLTLLSHLVRDKVTSSERTAPRAGVCPQAVFTALSTFGRKNFSTLSL